MAVASCCLSSHHFTDPSVGSGRVGKQIKKQESIPVGCVPPAQPPYVLQFNIHQMSAAGGGVIMKTSLNRSLFLATRCHQQEGAGTCIVRSNASLVMVTWDPSSTPTTPRTHRQTQLKTLPSRKFVGGRQLSST